MEWLLIIFYCVLFTILIYSARFFNNPYVPFKYFLIAFVLKIFCSWSYYILYVYYNVGGDSIKFFEEGKYLSELYPTNRKVFFEILTGTGNDNELLPYLTGFNLWFNSDFFYNDSRTLVRCNALLNFITGGFYTVNAIWFAFFSMIGCTALFNVFSKVDVQKTRIIFIVIFFIPSSLFWTAGISKEAWLIFLIGIFIFSSYQLYSNIFRLKYFFVAALSVYLLIYIKIYFLLALLPALVSFLIAGKLTRLNPLYIYGAVYLSGIIFLMLIPGFDFIDYVSRKQNDFINFALFLQSGSFINIPVVEDNWWSFFKNIPFSLWNILSRPYLWEAKSFFWLIPAIENLLIMIMIAAGIIGFEYNRQRATISYACVFFALSILILIGLTTPVIGSLWRYKAPLIPFLLMFFVFHFDVKKLKSRIGIQ